MCCLSIRSYWVACVYTKCIYHRKATNFSQLFNLNTFLISFNFNALKFPQWRQLPVCARVTVIRSVCLFFFFCYSSSFVFKAFDKCFSVHFVSFFPLLFVSFRAHRKSISFCYFYCKICVFIYLIMSNLFCAHASHAQIHKLIKSNGRADRRNKGKTK